MNRTPSFGHAERELLLARRAGDVVGRIAAIDDRLHEQVHQDGAGFFGFFESTDDAAVAGALFDAAAGFLRARGRSTMRGPVSPSINDEAGLLVDGFATPSVVMMPHNPPYYVGLVEGAGFRKAKDLLAYQATHDRLPERLLEGARLVERRYGIRLRALDVRRFDDEVAHR